MKSYRITMLKSAIDDLAQLADYLIEYSPDVALKTYDKIIKKINELSYFPYRHEQYPIKINRYVYRKLIIDRYLVFYVITFDSVEIHRIIDSRRNIPHSF